MKIIDCAQGSDEWIAARLGIPTASEFHRIITAIKGDLSKSARKYAYELVAETLLGAPLDSGVGNLKWVARGKLLEPDAVQQYEFSNDMETRAVGFVTNETGTIGCSPDRLIVGERAGLEIKCPAPATHIGYLIDGPGEDYKQQVQACMAICEAEWWDFYSYHDGLPPVLLRTFRDELYIAKMRSALADFLDMRDEMLLTVRRSGFFAPMLEAA